MAPKISLKNLKTFIKKTKANEEKNKIMEEEEIRKEQEEYRLAKEQEKIDLEELKIKKEEKKADIKISKQQQKEIDRLEQIKRLNLCNEQPVKIIEKKIECEKISIDKTLKNIIGFIGPTKSGKSTLFSELTGFISNQDTSYNIFHHTNNIYIDFNGNDFYKPVFKRIYNTCDYYYIVVSVLEIDTLYDYIELMYKNGLNFGIIVNKIDCIDHHEESIKQHIYNIVAKYEKNNEVSGYYEKCKDINVLFTSCLTDSKTNINKIDIIDQSQFKQNREPRYLDIICNQKHGYCLEIITDGNNERFKSDNCMLNINNNIYYTKISRFLNNKMNPIKNIDNERHFYLVGDFDIINLENIKYSDNENSKKYIVSPSFNNFYLIYSQYINNEVAVSNHFYNITKKDLTRLDNTSHIICCDYKYDNDKLNILNYTNAKECSSKSLDIFAKHKSSKMESDENLIVYPVKLQLLKCFRAKDPIIIGCKILAGRLKVGTPLYIQNNNISVGTVMSIFYNEKEIDTGVKDMEISIKINNADIDFKRSIEKINNVSLASKLTMDGLKILKTKYSYEKNINHDEELELIKKLIIEQKI